ncbi:MAG: DUF86 domain-containing protein [Methanoregula sp.]|nr:DUF86 domain-containing protein [Methanoregula sp.]
MKDDTIYLRHILDEITFLSRISHERTLDDLISDDYFSHAVRSAIEVIGEAANNVPDQIKSDSPEIPWREMAVLRNRIIHGYFRIDYSIVWNVIVRDLPEVEPKISALLKRLNSRSG